MVVLDDMVNFLYIVIVSVVSVLSVIYLIGCNKRDREIIDKSFIKLVNKIK